ncbi:MAG: hypothetical protein QOJ13_2395 [Gaiellales bacterium]|jgi:hypothetical protein|nr:hypothetical protein [Gaiellales bacterium]
MDDPLSARGAGIVSAAGCATVVPGTVDVGGAVVFGLSAAGFLCGFLSGFFVGVPPVCGGASLVVGGGVYVVEGGGDVVPPPPPPPVAVGGGGGGGGGGGSAAMARPGPPANAKVQSATMPTVRVLFMTPLASRRTGARPHRVLEPLYTSLTAQRKESSLASEVPVAH